MYSWVLIGIGFIGNLNFSGHYVRFSVWLFRYLFDFALNLVKFLCGFEFLFLVGFWWIQDFWFWTWLGYNIVLHWFENGYWYDFYNEYGSVTDSMFVFSNSN